MLLNPVQQRRPGFSLVELLVVIAIITILMAMTAAGTLRLMAEQQQEATNTTLSKLASEVNKQWISGLLEANETPLDRAPQTVMQMAGNDPKIARVVFNKLLMQREFPMRFSDVYQPAGGLPPKQDYVDHIARAGGYGQSESSVCLVMALGVMRRGSGVPPANFLNSNELVERFGNGVPEVVDAWGFPIELFLWPAYDQDPRMNPPELLGIPQARDPMDPDRLLSGSFPGAGTFSAICHPVQAGYSYKLHPVVVSPGRNGRFGLSDDRFLGIQDWDAASDNIYSYRLREQGARGD
jgi:prepilin-type N-terminal cleavage/methylation domain-containing protein